MWKKRAQIVSCMCGAGYLEHELRITDPEILSAVRYHTTARTGMSLVEKIVFLADFISIDRDYPGVEQMRKLAYQDLMEAIIEGLGYTIGDLARHYAPIHPDTVAAFNEALLTHPKLPHKKGK